MNKEDFREGLWQILHNHKRENEWSGVVIDILSFIKEAGYVKLADDQNLPEIPEAPVYLTNAYAEAERVAFRAGCLVFRNIMEGDTSWRKVQLEV